MYIKSLCYVYIDLKSFSLNGFGNCSNSVKGFTLTATSSSGLNQLKLIKC